MKQRKGFVLVPVLIITTITAMLAFSQLNDNRLQERIAGNQQKEINARLAAEKGVFDAFEYIKARNKQGNKNKVIADGLKEPGFSMGKYYSFPLDKISFNATTISLVSMGEHDGAIAYLKTVINTVEADSIFDNAIIACKSVSLWGSGSIDSYSGGPYSATTAGSNGNVSVIGGKDNVTYKKESAIQGDISEYSGECDPLNITTEICNMATQVTGSPGDFKPSSDTVFDGSTVAGVTPVSLDVLGASKQVYVFDDFDVKQQDIVIRGDVTLYIQGDMTIKLTDFTLADNSSLTIFIEGKMNVDTNSNVFTDQHVSSALTVYSSNRSSEAVTLNGNADIYMNLYAPLGTVAYKGNGDIMGAVRADVVDISGNGSLHYDENLGGSGEAVSYSSVYYYYPGNDPTDSTNTTATADIVETANTAQHSGYSGNSGVCGNNKDDDYSEICGYSPRSYDNEYIEYSGAAEAAAKAVEVAAAAAKTAVELAAASAREIAAITDPAEAAIATAAVAAAAAKTTACTAFAAAAETRWAAAAAAAAVVAATVDTAAAVAEAAGATPAQKAAAKAVAKAAAVAAAAVVKEVDVAATAAARAAGVAAASAAKAVVVAAAAATEIAATTDASAKAALIAKVAATLADTTAATAKAAEDTAAAVVALKTETMEAVAARAAKVATATAVVATAYAAEAAGPITLDPVRIDGKNSNFWSMESATVTTKVEELDRTTIITVTTVTRIDEINKSEIKGTETTKVTEITTVDEKGDMTTVIKS